MSMKLDNPYFKRIEILVDKAWFLTHPIRKEAPLCEDLHKTFEAIKYYILKIQEEGGD